MNKTEAGFMVAVVPLHVLGQAERGIDTLLPLGITIDPLSSVE